VSSVLMTSSAFAITSADAHAAESRKVRRLAAQLIDHSQVLMPRAGAVGD